jgi:hypothetical protein
VIDIGRDSDRRVMMTPRTGDVLQASQGAEQRIVSQLQLNVLKIPGCIYCWVTYHFLDLPLGQAMYIIHLGLRSEKVALKATSLRYSTQTGGFRRPGCP